MKPTKQIKAGTQHKLEIVHTHTMYTPQTALYILIYLQPQTKTQQNPSNKIEQYLLESEIQLTKCNCTVMVAPSIVDVRNIAFGGVKWGSDNHRKMITLFCANHCKVIASNHKKIKHNSCVPVLF